jgi:Fic family protein
VRNFVLEELADALDDRSGQFIYLFIASTGKVEPYAAADPAGLRAQARADALPIPSLSHGDAHALIVDFIETLADGELADRLREAVSGSSGQARFLQVLRAYPRARRSWLSFRQRRLEALALDWLRANDVDLARFGLDQPARPLEEETGLRFDAALESRLEAIDGRIRAFAASSAATRASDESTPALAAAEAFAECRRALRVDDIYNSNAIRGNRLTREQTEDLLKSGATVGGLTLREHLEVVNLNRALDHAEVLAASSAPITEHAIRELHARLYAGIDDEIAGAYRRTDARVVGRDYLPPESVLVPALVRELMEWLEDTKADPLAKASAVQAKVLNIAPFADGNGRVGRLLTNVVLESAGYPPAIVRVEDRQRYYDSLRQADEGNMTELLALVIDCVEQSLQRFEAAIA